LCGRRSKSKEEENTVIKRTLGQSGLGIAPLAFGGNVFGWTADQATSFQLLDAFVAAGGNFIDTADLYSRWAPGHQGGESESIIGRWLKKSGKRHQVIIATTVGMELGPDKKGLSKGYIFRAAEDSLRRLQIDGFHRNHRDRKVPHASRRRQGRRCAS
jgi:aryl-alcohol dehydrogenase-like predicted oxidoreductase